MSLADKFLEACLQHLGEWTCSLHSTGSNQPAAIFREIKNRGYKFEEVRPNCWAKSLYCPICKRNTTHYKLLNAEPTESAHTRCGFNAATRARVIALLEKRDAFSGASIASTPEIDHKIPWTRMVGDIDASKLSDEEIKVHFQLLTREHNLLKDRACGKCKLTNIRPPFFGVAFWYKGNENYCGDCEGCGWYDGQKWRSELNNQIKQC